MRSTLLAIAGAAVLACGLGAAPSAEASQGCGPGFHRDYRGFCESGGYYGPRGYHGPREYRIRRGYVGRCFLGPTPYGFRRVCRY